VAFDARHKGRGVRAAAVHPGVIQTELGRYMTPEVIAQMTRDITKAQAAGAFNWKTIPQGAATSCWTGVVAGAEEVGGRYCEDCHVAKVETDQAVRGGVQPYALDPERAKALWSLSERLVGETF
jgi:NAD(P)-dependent dehydrogenase (short-subunit alcohol dehydrogenase family)